MKAKARSRLIVEGQDDLFSVVGLMRAHTPWPQPKYEAPVWIDLGNSAEEIMRPEYLSSLLKASDIDILGLLLDADTKPRSRYGRIRTACLAAFPDLPEEIPKGGVVAENAGKKRFGVWVMPDNAAEGCLETFLRHLVPEESEPLWVHAGNCSSKAKELGAKWRDVHEPKAKLYTWLAWQDPPGQNPGVALAKKILDPHSKEAASFVKWFKELYKLA